MCLLWMSNKLQGRRGLVHGALRVAGGPGAALRLRQPRSCPSAFCLVRTGWEAAVPTLMTALSGRQSCMDRYAWRYTQGDRHIRSRGRGEKKMDTEKEGKVKTKTAPAGYLLCARDCANPATCCCMEPSSSQLCLRHQCWSVPLNHGKVREGAVPGV